MLTFEIISQNGCLHSRGAYFNVVLLIARIYDIAVAAVAAFYTTGTTITLAALQQCVCIIFMNFIIPLTLLINPTCLRFAPVLFVG